MDIKKFSQQEVNQIVNTRLKRERKRLIKEFENKVKRCMASIHILVHQDMCELKRDLADETKDLSDPVIRPKDAAKPRESCKSE